MGNQRPRGLLRLCGEALLALGHRVIDLHSPARSPFTGRIRTVDHHVGIVARTETGGKQRIPLAFQKSFQPVRKKVTAWLHNGMQDAFSAKILVEFPAFSGGCGTMRRSSACVKTSNRMMLAKCSSTVESLSAQSTGRFGNEARDLLSPL